MSFLKTGVYSALDFMGIQFPGYLYPLSHEFQITKKYTTYKMFHCTEKQNLWNDIHLKLNNP